ncbi:hypothetical protein ACFQ80_00260 [Isoptericola sp. NPDC056578]|uniref:hypothetical protein n=1 Tax=Isoptericola sp. NPDC056578 TaxID=3345870 RepID=UPI003698FE3F
MTSAGRLRLRSPGGEHAVEVDPTGARVASLVHTPTGTELLLRLPWEDEDWSGAFPSASSNEEWHRRYAGGWHTLVPHAGDARTVDGVQHPFHGEAAWRRWRVLAHDAGSCTLEVVLRTVPLTVRRTVRATAAGLEVEQRVANHAPRPVAFTWTEHPAFGGALAGPGSTVTLGGDPVEAAFPRDGEPSGGFQSLRAKGRGDVELRNDAAGVAVVLRFDPDLFPHVHVWQEHRATAGFPWWGAVDAVALEPACRPYDPDDDALGPLVLAGGAELAARFEIAATVRGTHPTPHPTPHPMAKEPR